jgi:hypothetical protein
VRQSLAIWILHGAYNRYQQLLSYQPIRWQRSRGLCWPLPSPCYSSWYGLSRSSSYTPLVWVWCISTDCFNPCVICQRREKLASATSLWMAMFCCASPDYGWVENIGSTRAIVRTRMITCENPIVHFREKPPRRSLVHSYRYETRKVRVVRGFCVLPRAGFSALTVKPRETLNSLTGTFISNNLLTTHQSLRRRSV